ncbi:MAG: hypothetical protein QW767_04760 [Thermoprotei archaeon]
MIAEAASLALYLCLLAFAGYLAASGAERFESRYGSGVAGGLLLGFLGTLPEYVFVLKAVTLDQGEIALGSAVGGNIVLFTLGIALLLAASIRRNRSQFKWQGFLTDSTILVVTALVFLLDSFRRLYSVYTGLFLIAAYMFYVQQTVSKRAQSAPSASSNITGSPPVNRNPVSSVRIGVVLSLISIALTLTLVNPLINSVRSFSATIGVPEFLVASVLVPFADEFPEMVSTTLLAFRQGGNLATPAAGIVGSKVQNNTLLLGSMILASYIGRTPLGASSMQAQLGVVFMAAATIMGLAALLLRGPKIPKMILLLALYSLSVSLLYLF